MLSLSMLLCRLEERLEMVLGGNSPSRLLVREDFLEAVLTGVVSVVLASASTSFARFAGDTIAVGDCLSLSSCTRHGGGFFEFGDSGVVVARHVPVIRDLVVDDIHW